MLAAQLKQRIFPWGSNQDFWLGLFIASLLINILALVFPITLMQLYQHIIPNSDFHDLVILLSVLVISIILEKILALARHTIANWTDARLTLKNNTTDFAQFSQSQLQDFQNQNNTIKLPNLTTNSCAAKKRLAMFNLPFSIIFFIFLAYLNIWLALIAIIIALIFLPLLKVFQTKQHKNLALQQFIYQTLSQNINQQQQATLLSKYQQLAKQDIISNYQQQTDCYSAKAIMNLGLFLGLLAVAVLGTVFVLNNNLTPGALAASLLLTLQLLRAVLITGYHSFTIDKTEQQNLLQHDNSKTTSTELVATTSAYKNCLLPLCNALKIQDDINASQQDISLYDLKNMLKNQGFATHYLSISLDNLDTRLLPGLFVKDNQVLLILEKTADHIKAYDANKQQHIELTDLSSSGEYYFFQATTIAEQKHWLVSAIQPIKKFLYFTLSINFVNSLLLLSMPLFIVLLYDHVIRNLTTSTLIGFSIGILLAIISIFSLQWLGSHFTSLSSAKLLNNVNFTIYQHLLKQHKDQHDIRDLSSELQDFINLRQFFTGPMLNILLKLPFVILSFIALIFFGSNLYLIAIVAFIILIIFMIFASYKLDSILPTLNTADIEQQKFILTQSLQLQKIDATKQQQFKQLTAKKSMLSFKLNFTSETIATIGTVITAISLVLTLGFGAVAIMHSALTLGGLLACLLLMWMTLYPINQLIIKLADLLRFIRTWRRVIKLMRSSSLTIRGNQL